MRDQIITLAEENRKVFGYSEKQIITSTKKHSSFDSLYAAMNKSSMLEVVSVVPMESLQEISFNEKEDPFTITYDKNGASKKDSFLLEDVNNREAIVADLASIKNFKRNTTVESKAKPLAFNLVVLAVVVICTWGARNIALDAEAGVQFEASGKRKALQNMVADAIGTIGPTWSMLIGAIGLVYMIYRTYSRYQNPATIIKYY